jgi:hypothetical protein
MVEIESYHELCRMKSGVIAVDEHLIYLVKKGALAALPEQVLGKKPTDSSIIISNIRQAEARPGSGTFKAPQVALRHKRGDKEVECRVVFPGDGAGGARDFIKFVSFLKSKNVPLKEITIASETGAVDEKTPAGSKKRLIMPLLLVFFIAAVVALAIFKQYIVAGILSGWVIYLIYKTIKPE